MSVYNVFDVATDVGSKGIFSPDSSVNSTDDYLRFMRTRYRAFEWQQRIGIAVVWYKRTPGRFTFSGPYAEQAKMILESL
jgi:hypothetical protein